MGIGDPEGILRVIGAGVDMFDCVLPTRLGRTGSATTWEGRLNLRNARFARDDRPLQEGCECPACTRFSRAYIRHLVTQDELLGPAAADAAQPLFLLELCREARRAIIEHRFAGFSAAALERLGSGTAQRTPGEARGGQMSDAEITVVWIVGLAALTWFVFIRPRRRMMTRQRELLGALSTGDQVVTVGGIYGTIVALDGDEVRVEIAPDVVIRVARRAVAGRVGPPSATVADEPEQAEEPEELDADTRN